MKYKVGDKVRIRTDLKLGHEYGSNNFTIQMLPHKGKTVTITDTVKDGYLIDDNIVVWTEEMIERAIELEGR